eukprot:CAMPEP_0118966946 /NCGR_PEP_ID=MMETSP1173-20130426/4388_1 /TAXON_ID=1034831 /ORGANISM="Rhizochromulina marina cf, Strain CCMP1243" /LENGTH=205 /DNA_ID=CAMNT_0006915825 /DNA_START=14 /DNA_END=631 /DNA_ORIENTATION=-
MGLVSEADGSARFGLGATVVTAAVRGPRLSKGSALDALSGVSGAFTLDVHFRGPATMRQNETGRWKTFLADVLRPLILAERYPRSCLTLSLHCSHDDGAMLAAAVNAAAAALVDAGVELRGIPVACQAGVDRDRKSLLLDPQRSTDPTSAEATFVFVAPEMHPVAVHQSGPIDPASLPELESMAQQACVSIANLARHAVGVETSA